MERKGKVMFLFLIMLLAFMAVPKHVNAAAKAKIVSLKDQRIDIFLKREFICEESYVWLRTELLAYGRCRY